MVKKLALWVLVIALMVTIFCFSHQEGSDSLNLSDSLLYKILAFFNVDIKMRTFGFLNVAIRKLAHFSIYGALGFFVHLLIGEGYEIKGKRGFVISMTASLMYAISDELHQYFVPGRSAMATDVLIDFSGAVTGIALAGLVVWLLARRRNDG